MQLATECGPQQGEAARTWEVRPGSGVWSPHGRLLLLRPLNTGTETDVVVKVNSCLVFRVLVSEQF